MMTLEEFDTAHGSSVTSALSLYIERMRGEAKNARATFEAIKDDPEKRAAQDQSMMTTMGLFHSAKIFDEAADRAENALTAYQDMTEGLDEDEPDLYPHH